MDRATHVQTHPLRVLHRMQSAQGTCTAPALPGLGTGVSIAGLSSSRLSVDVTGTGWRQRLGACQNRAFGRTHCLTARSRGGVEDRREAVEAAVPGISQSNRYRRYSNPSTGKSGRFSRAEAWEGEGEEEWEEGDSEERRRRGEGDGHRNERRGRYEGAYQWQEEEGDYRDEEEGGWENGDRGESDEEDAGEQGDEGSFLEASRQTQRVAVFWDLDNKQPLEVRPGDAARRLRDVAAQLAPGAVDILAYANRHAFDFVPERIREERRQRRELEQMERMGAVLVSPSGEPTVHPCSLCGRKFRTSLELRRHFTSLHQKEHQKRMAHLNSLGPGRRKKVKGQQKWRERVGRYQEAASELVEPKQGYGLMPELRRAGVHVRLVSQAPQAADDAIRVDMARAVKSGLVSVVCLVSDDRGYAQALTNAKTQYGVKVAVVGSAPSLERWADLWMSWEDVVAGAGYTIQEARNAALGWSKQRERGSSSF